MIDELPSDPFTGKPYVYKLQQEGFVLYSLGSNQKDDTGRSTLKMPALIMEKDDDLAWIEMP